MQVIAAGPCASLRQDRGAAAAAPNCRRVWQRAAAGGRHPLLIPGSGAGRNEARASGATGLLVRQQYPATAAPEGGSGWSNCTQRCRRCVLAASRHPRGAAPRLAVACRSTTPTAAAAAAGGGGGGGEAGRSGGPAGSRPLHPAALNSLYAMYFCACFVERTWRFGLPLVLAFIPGGFQAIAILGFVAPLACSLAGPAVRGRQPAQSSTLLALRANAWHAHRPLLCLGTSSALLDCCPVRSGRAAGPASSAEPAAPPPPSLPPAGGAHA